MAKAKQPSMSATMERRGAKERREPSERRQQSVPVAVERRQAERRKVPRRRQIDPTTCERDYSDAEVEFMNALDDYKRRNGRMFPTCSEILEVVRGLGYEKRTPPQAEAPAAPSPSVEPAPAGAEGPASFDPGMAQ